MRGVRRGRVVVYVAICVGLMAAPAQAAFPGLNGKIAFDDCACPGRLYTINPDGSARTSLPLAGFGPTWSPDGSKIATVADDLGRVQVANADGSGAHIVYDPSNRTGGTVGQIDWSPDGRELVVAETVVVAGGADEHSLQIVDLETGTPRFLIDPGRGEAVTWSPRGDRIAFDGQIGGNFGIFTIRPDGTGLQQVTSARFAPDFSPDGSRLAARRFDGSQTDVVVMNADGSGEVQLTDDPATDEFPSWSPDGTRIVFLSTRVPAGLYTMKSDGSDEAFLTESSLTHPDWQPIPVNGYVRPKGASPTRVSLVPAYEPCTAPNRTHGPPLAFGSCNPPARVPGQLTIGTFDSNGQPAKSVSYIRINPIRGNPATPADEADVRMRGTINDVRLASDLSDYTGNLEARLSIRITDKNNTPHPGGPGPATVVDFTHVQPLPCAATADTTVGATCAFDTTLEAIMPGAVKEQQRSVWELDAVRIHDGAGNLFLTQGIFVP